MSWTLVEKGGWRDLFDSLSRSLEGTQVEVEVVGLDIGDQFEVDWVPLRGLTYEPKKDTLFVYIATIEHAIANPQEIWLQLGSDGLAAATIIDREEHKQFIRLRRPLALPPSFRAAG